MRNRNHSAIKDNLKKMIELAKSQDIQVVLIGVPQKAIFSNSASFYEELADEFQLVFDGKLIMKQAIMTAPKVIEFNDVPVPAIKPDEVLIKIKRIGVCGSDIHVYHGIHPYPGSPRRKCEPSTTRCCRSNWRFAPRIYASPICGLSFAGQENIQAYLSIAIPQRDSKDSRKPGADPTTFSLAP